MAVLGIIAEFNPFHNGHLHLLRESQKQHDFEAIICVMSGNFLQRGEPALCSKWSRAEMAIQAGADLVMELPFCFAVRSAYYFARGALTLLYKTGVVTHLAFGSESGNLAQLQAVSSIIAHESDEYQKQLKDYLSQGLSFPVARSRALQSNSGVMIPDIRDILMQPNNILALEYLRILEEEHIPIVPFTVLRKGQGYHSTELSPWASASAIRRALQVELQTEKVKDSMPSGSFNILRREITAGRSPVPYNALEQSILMKLRTASAENLQKIYEISEGLENRIRKAAVNSRNLDELCQQIKSKRYSMTRIKRMLLYTLLDVTYQDIHLFDNYGPLYLHTLAFSTRGQKILQRMKNYSLITILNRGSQVKKAHTDKNQPVLSRMLDLDIRATDLYSLLYPNPEERSGGLDYIISPVRVAENQGME